VAATPEEGRRVSAYLDAVAERLAPLSREFVHDVAAFAPAEEVYRRNTAAAADRIRELIADGIEAGAFRPVDAAFVAEIVAATMVGIQSGQMSRRLGMSDSDAYAELSALVVHILAR
jgi:AcrR family transcriptional regulator